MKDDLTPERLRQLLAYNALSGKFVWIKRRSGTTAKDEAAAFLAPPGIVKS